MQRLDLPIVVAVAALLVWLVYGRRILSRNKHEQPPALPQRFFSGMAHSPEIQGPEVPRTYLRWAKEYGDIFHYDVYTEKVVVLNSAKASLDLLDKRSGIYSDRRRSVMLGELCKRPNSVFGMSTSNPLFKDYRKMMNSGMNTRAVKKYEPIQDMQTVILLDNLLKTPEKFISHLRRNAAALILKIIYGYEVNQNDDEFVSGVDRAFRFNAGLTGRVFMVDYFPILKYLPSWFPFAPWKKLARAIIASRPETAPYMWAKGLIASGDYKDSFTSIHLRPEGGQMVGEEEEDKIQNVSAALFLGGSDTTVSAMTTLFYVMTMNPHVLKKAQAELDTVVGTDRLPQMSDLGSLPYINAVIKEILRWSPPVPLGLRHRITDDDIYENLFIPKGSILISNIWAITRDPELYPNPDQFNPERYLGEKAQPDPQQFVFGYGRRICPGIHLAEVSLFLSVARVIASMDIKKSLDASGREIDPDLIYTGGTIAHLKPFDCRITPRNKKAAELIQAGAAAFGI